VSNARRADLHSRRSERQDRALIVGLLQCSQ